MPEPFLVDIAFSVFMVAKSPEGHAGALLAYSPAGSKEQEFAIVVLINFDIVDGCIGVGEYFF